MINSLTPLLLRCLLVILALGGQWAYSQEALDLAALKTTYSLGQHLHYLEDPDHRLDIETVISHPAQWTKSQQSTPNFGYSHSSYWFKIPLRNSGSQTVRTFLEVAYPVLDTVEIHYVQQGRITQSFLLGDTRPFDTRPIDHRHFVTPLALDHNEEVTLFIKLRTSGTLQLPLTLWDQLTFLEYQGVDQFVQGIYFGFMIIMALYNLFLYLSVREKSYLYYVIYVVSLVLMQACLLGFAYKFLWPQSLAWQQISMPFFLSLVVGSICLFTYEFLHVPTHSRWIGLALNSALVLALLSAAASFFLSYSVIIRIVVLLAVPACTACLAAGGIALARGDQVARYYMLAWSLLLIGAILLVATRFNWLPSNAVTVNVFQFGSALEAVMLSLALAVRIKHAREQQLQAERETLRAEKIAREAQEQALRIQEKANQELEDKVQQRTQELQNALGHLSQTTEKLEILSCTDSLTNVYNRRFFNDSYATLYQDAAKHRLPLAVMMLDIDHFKQINDTHGHLAGDHILVAVAQVIKNVLRPTDFVARYGGEEFVIVLQRAAEEDAVRVAERVRTRIEELQAQHDKQVISVTASIGVAAEIPDPAVPNHQLLANADHALYEAKANGRNRTRPYKAA